MSLDHILEDYPKEGKLKEGFTCQLRPLQTADEKAFHTFFQAIPERERMFIKHRVTDTSVIHDWCQNIDMGRNLALLALQPDRIIGCATLHQHLGGWKRHVGRVSVLVHPHYRTRGLGRALVAEVIELAGRVGLERIEAEFLADQATAIKLFGVMGFSTLVRLPNYVKDMQAITHDYVLMGLDLEADEEYAGMG
jgi:GNAT superfamily N-acetyltransferase